MTCAYCHAEIRGMADSRILTINGERLVVCLYVDECNRRRAQNEGRPVAPPGKVVELPPPVPPSRPTRSVAGAFIANARIAKLLSQRELAARITNEDGTPVSATLLNDIEWGRQAASPFILCRLAEELDLQKENLCLLARA